MKTYSKFTAVIFKLRGVLMLPPILFLVLFGRAAWHHDVSVWASGLVVFALGTGIRVWSQRHLKYRLATPSGLATTGPYRWIRNPVYVGNVCLFAGVSILCGLPWAAPLFAAWAFTVYSIAIRFEESRLRRRYGDAFVEYCRTVPRWFPRSPAALTTSESTASGWGRALAVEWQCLLLLAIPIVKQMAFS